MSASAGHTDNEQWSAGTRTTTNQYSVTEYDTVVHKGEMQMPSVWFSYDISPISVTISEIRKSFAHLLVRFCAVVGGVFAVTGQGCLCAWTSVFLAFAAIVCAELLTQFF